MTEEKLQKANELKRRITEYEQAMNCFEWSPEPGKVFSTDPRLIIEFDGGDGREQIALPMNLSDTLVELLKREIASNMATAKAHFETL